MTDDQAKAVLSDLRAVCERHGVAIIPVEPVAGRYGRIEIVPVADMPAEDREHVTNSVTCERFTVGGRELETVYAYGIGARPCDIQRNESCELPATSSEPPSSDCSEEGPTSGWGSARSQDSAPSGPSSAP